MKQRCCGSMGRFHFHGLGNKMPRQRCTAIQLQRLFKNIVQEGKHWIWTGKHLDDGYPRIRWGKRSEGKPANVYVHRLMFAIFRGAIKAEVDVHHKCRIRKCVNPWHVQAIQHVEHGTSHGPESHIPF